MKKLEKQINKIAYTLKQATPARVIIWLALLSSILISLFLFTDINSGLGVLVFLAALLSSVALFFNISLLIIEVKESDTK